MEMPNPEDKDDGGVFRYPAPAKVVIESEANGIKKIFSYEIDDEQGKRVKVVDTIHLPNLPNLLNLLKRSTQRRSWEKFGDAASQYLATTMISTEESRLEPPTSTPPDTRAEARVLGLDLMYCGACGVKGDHWTSECPTQDGRAFLIFCRICKVRGEHWPNQCPSKTTKSSSRKPVTDAAAPGPSK